MVLFSCDADVVRVEPGVFAGSPFAGQVLCSGANGVLAGTAFSAAVENFIGKGVAAGHVIVLQSLDGAINAAYEVVSVVSATQLEVSAVRADSQTPAIPVGTSSGLIYRIATFGPQAAIAAEEITARLGLRPGCSENTYGPEHIVDATPLRMVSVYRVLMMVFVIQAGTTDAGKTFAVRHDYYKRLYCGAFNRLRIAVDVERDGVPERMIVGGVVRCIRK
ncbi:MAG: hypothetical protein ABFD91_14680 [Anaerohalosphaeraceae bacterium]